jgi:LytR cell envelope-related transcriptional attenuator
MGRVNLGTARIVIIVALAAGGIALLANGFAGTVVTPADADGGGAASPSSASPTDSASPSKTPRETPSPEVEGVQIAVLNGTNEVGLAGEVQQLLVDDGYLPAQDAADADAKPVPKTIVYFRGGADAAQGRSNARYVADTYFDGARVGLLDPDQAANIAETAQVIIIIGVDYAGASTNGG